MVIFEGMKAPLPQTEFLPTDNLDERGAISKYQVVKALYMRESILGSETRLQRGQIGRK
jgi:hypothetical protein